MDPQSQTFVMAPPRNHQNDGLPTTPRSIVGYRSTTLCTPTQPSTSPSHTMSRHTSSETNTEQDNQPHRFVTSRNRPQNTDPSEPITKQQEQPQPQRNFLTKRPRAGQFPPTTTTPPSHTDPPTPTSVVVSRRPSRLIVNREKKTEHWKDFNRRVEEQGVNMTQDQLDSVIERALSLGVVGQGDSSSAPTSLQMIEQLKHKMERRLTELTAVEHSTDPDVRTGASLNSIEKILHLHRLLASLESRKCKEEEEEKKRVQNKVLELRQSYKRMKAEEDSERRLARRSLVGEMEKLKERVSSIQREKESTQAEQEIKMLCDKMNRLEAVLRLMNTDQRFEGKDALLLKRKLALFEQKLKEMETEAKMKEEEYKKDEMKDKLLEMEQKLVALEKSKLINNDEKTSLTQYIKHLETNTSQQEKRIEELRRALLEQKLNFDKRQREDEAYRLRSLKIEEELRTITEKLVRGNEPIRPTERCPPPSPLVAERRQGEGEEGREAQRDAIVEELVKKMDKLAEQNAMLAKEIEKLRDPRNPSTSSFEELNAKLAEIQTKLFDPNTTPRESEILNISYDKLMTELEQTPEYKKQQVEIRQKWKKDNETANKQAFDRVFANINAMPTQKRTASLNRKPELKLLFLSPQQLLVTHPNDFKKLSTQNLLLLEARALYHHMPQFRIEQEQQVQFVQQLQGKIEAEAAKPSTPVPPPIVAKRAVVVKIPKAQGGGGGGFLGELLQKRKERG